MARNSPPARRSCHYGTTFRSTPVYFLQDDHDHWENDSPLTYPVPWFQLQLARMTQQLYYPEFLPDANRSVDLPYSTRSERGELSESFGTMRYGDLLEVLLYDVRRTLNVGDLNPIFWIELLRTARRADTSDTRHLIHVPSNPPGWTAESGSGIQMSCILKQSELTIRFEATLATGWADQHDESCSLWRTYRNPMVISGDSYSRVAPCCSGNRSFADNPITAVLCGPVSTAERGFPSNVRGRAAPSAYLDFQQQFPPIEEHGFSIVDFERDRIEVKLFKWDVNSQPQRH